MRYHVFSLINVKFPVDLVLLAERMLVHKTEQIER